MTQLMMRVSRCLYYDPTMLGNRCKHAPAYGQNSNPPRIAKPIGRGRKLMGTCGY